MNPNILIIFAFIFAFIKNVALKENISIPFSGIYYDPRKCGISVSRNKRYVRKPNYHLKVMGGTDVETGEHPWTVAIYMNDVYCCVGTLISNKHVITAAHCFLREGVKPSLGKCRPKQAITEEEALQHTKIMYGSKCLKRKKFSNCFNSKPMKTVGIIRAQYGRFFRQGCFGGDIALLELEHEINEKDANYICLASRILLNEKFYSIQSVGWGSNPAMKRILMNNLQKLEFHRLLDRNMCAEKINNLPNDILCTEEAHNQNVCLGDSGAGLMVQLHNGRWLLLGIVSYGSSCDKLLQKRAQPLAQVYTNVKMYRGEIDKFTEYFLPWEQV
uniref:Peptidase S1 domain-containing protein n=2 Tax=Wuchereria bancrofti TaxID=6293 RepID=A0AAF5PQI7_WUCBA